MCQRTGTDTGLKYCEQLAEKPDKRRKNNREQQETIKIISDQERGMDKSTETEAHVNKKTKNKCTRQDNAQNVQQCGQMSKSRREH